MPPDVRVEHGGQGVRLRDTVQLVTAAIIGPQRTLPHQLQQLRLAVLDDIRNRPQ